MADVPESNEVRGAGSWLPHLGGAVLGLVFAAGIEGMTVLEGALRDVMLREGVAWPHWTTIGMYLLLGPFIVTAILLGRRLPWLPTVAAILLLYGVAESSFTPLGHLLPWLGPWQPSVRSGMAVVTLTAGLMTAAATWGWLSYRSQARPTS